jgi:Ca2+-binding RTX toxin-like protein
MAFDLNNWWDSITASSTVGGTATSSGLYDFTNDDDLIEVNVGFSGTLEFYLDGIGADPTITLYDANGTYLAYDDDSAPTPGGNYWDSLLSYNVDPGTYYLNTIPFSGTAGGSWQLTVTTTAVSTSGGGSSAVGTDGASSGTTSGDFITGGSLDWTYHGSGGSDFIAAGSGNDLVNGNTENYTLSGGAGNDVIYLGQNDGPATTHPEVNMSRQRQGVEYGYGNDGDDIIYGNFGGDYILGGAGNDVLYGGQDNDTLVGGSGNDTLMGNRDADVLSGGTGADQFIWHPFTGGQDTISDFSTSEGDFLLINAGFSYSVGTNSSGNVVISSDISDDSIELIGVASVNTITDYISTF